jgi:hypothetical protein
MWGRNQQNAVPWVCDAHILWHDLQHWVHGWEAKYSHLHHKFVKWLCNLSHQHLGRQYDMTLPLLFDLGYAPPRITLCAHPSKKNPQPIIMHKTQWKAQRKMHYNMTSKRRLLCHTRETWGPYGNLCLETNVTRCWYLWACLCLFRHNSQYAPCSDH